MVFSISPSVTIREVDLTAVVPAISTPPAAIAGVFRWGPINERILVTSEDDLVNRFGKPHANTSWQNFETFFSAADFLSYSNSLYVTRVVDNAVTAEGTYFAAKYHGILGNSLEVSVTSSGSFEEVLADVGDIAASNTAVIAFNSNQIAFELPTDIVGTIRENDIIRIGNDNIGYQDLVVNEFTDGGDVTAPFSFAITTKNRYTLTEDDLSALKIVRRWGYSNRVGGSPVANTVSIVVSDKTGDITGVPRTVLEVYENVSTSPSAKLADGSTNYYVDIIANKSSWVVASDGLLTSSFVNPIYDAMLGGSDGSGEASVSFGKIAEGYDLYKDSNEVDISAIIQGKALNTNLANYIISNIAERRKDCIVYISPAYLDVVAPANPNEKMNNVINFRTGVNGAGGLQNSSYWFMDSGYKYRYDKYNDVYRWVPLNGDIAGLAARVEPWESPAGYKRGLVKNVIKLAFNPNKEQRDQLYGNDINPVISQVGQGVLLFGDKTGLGTATGSAFTRINVRRLFITVEKAIATVAASFLFDFNDEFTQTQFKNLVDPFLRDIQGKRGIIDFRVISDGTVNTPDVIDRNIFRGNIFIKPARSINFIELTFVATRTGVEFDEIVGQAL